MDCLVLVFCSDEHESPTDRTSQNFFFRNNRNVDNAVGAVHSSTGRTEFRVRFRNQMCLRDAVKVVFQGLLQNLPYFRNYSRQLHERRKYPGTQFHSVDGARIPAGPGGRLSSREPWPSACIVSRSRTSPKCLWPASYRKSPKHRTMDGPRLGPELICSIGTLNFPDSRKSSLSLHLLACLVPIQCAALRFTSSPSPRWAPGLRPSSRIRPLCGYGCGLFHCCTKRIIRY